MTLEIHTFPALSDNYFFLIHNSESGDTALVDAPDAAPVKTALAERGWRLTQILLTHHHYDHIDGAEELRRDTGATLVGAKADAHRLPVLDLEVSEGDRFTVLGVPCDVIDVSGHTLGHIAYYMPEQNAVFTGDSLMALGCGRLFEGTPPVMFESLQKLAALPDDTSVFSGHEYTAANGRFAATVEPGSPALKVRIRETAKMNDDGVPTVPAMLLLEKQTNPYLRCHLPEIQGAVQMEGADPVDVFAEVRRRKDNF